MWKWDPMRSIETITWPYCVRNYDSVPPRYWTQAELLASCYEHEVGPSSPVLLYLTVFFAKTYTLCNWTSFPAKTVKYLRRENLFPVDARRRILRVKLGYDSTRYRKWIRKKRKRLFFRRDYSRVSDCAS